jgi:hypothetical protein
MPKAPPTVPGPRGATDGPGAAIERWLRTARRPGELGIYAYGHEPKPPLDPDRVGDRKLIGKAIAALIGASVTYSLFHDYLYLSSLWLTPLDWLGLIPHAPVPGWTPDQVSTFNFSVTVYTWLWVTLIVAVFGRAGGWLEVIRRYLLPRLLPLIRRLRSAATDPGTAAGNDIPPTDPAQWPELRAAGQNTAADRLATDLQAGRMTDVDYTRLSRAWTAATASEARRDAFTKEVLRHGAAAFTHPSGARNLPVRTATHDLLNSQVRIGLATDDKRTPYEYRGTPIALEPAALRTSVLAVGPPGTGKTRRLVRPVVESLCLQALAGTAAVVVVAAAGTDLGPPDAFDVVISPGDPDSPYDLDLYGGTTDPDEAAAILAEALAGDTDRGTTALAQLLGPYRAAHGRFPAVTELRELLDGAPAAYATLRDALDEAGAHGYARDLDARQRQADRPDDIGTLLADRIALLDRPAFAGFFSVTDTRQFSLQALEHPLRVRIDLPARGHTEAARVLARLLLAQFTATVTRRPDRSPFACLVLDDAAHTITTGSVRALQHLRSANAGLVLAVRTLDDVPEQLRSTLLAAVGCPVALAGVTTWDGKHFAETWGTTWVETQDVTHAPDQSGGALRRATRGIRKAVTGEAVTTEAVTVRKVERARWSDSDLAHTLPPGHAVLSLSHADGRHTPPLLVNLQA